MAWECSFLVAEQEKNQKKSAKGALRANAYIMVGLPPAILGIYDSLRGAPPLWKPPPPRQPIPENVPIFGYLHGAIFSFLSCKRSKIGTFLDAGWRSGGWILKEGAFARSASLSRLLLVLFLPKQEKYIRSPPLTKKYPFLQAKHRSGFPLRC